VVAAHVRPFQSQRYCGSVYTSSSGRGARPRALERSWELDVFGVGCLECEGEAPKYCRSVHSARVVVSSVSCISRVRARLCAHTALRLYRENRTRSGAAAARRPRPPCRPPAAAPRPAVRAAPSSIGDMAPKRAKPKRAKRQGAFCHEGLQSLCTPGLSRRRRGLGREARAVGDAPREEVRVLLLYTRGHARQVRMRCGPAIRSPLAWRGATTRHARRLPPARSSRHNVNNHHDTAVTQQHATRAKTPNETQHPTTRVDPPQARAPRRAIALFPTRQHDGRCLHGDRDDSADSR
jgi:hypothetical protein